MGGLPEARFARCQSQSGYRRPDVGAARVDLLRSSTGPKILEVNSSPGLEGVERTSGKDVAGLIVEYLETHVKPIARRRSVAR